MKKNGIELMYFKKVENREVLLEKNFNDHDQLQKFIKDEGIKEKDILDIDNINELFKAFSEHFDV